MVTQDIRRYSSGNNFLSSLRVFLFHPGCRFMVLHRLCNHYAPYHPIGVVARFWHRRVKRKFGFQIPHKTHIGKGLFLGHYGGIVINQQVRIGQNCNIAQGVTIGQVNRGQKQGCPALGNRVWIGANAVVVGNISIGDDVLIAPLTYVNFDVPANSVVLGNPGKVVGDQGSAGYINSLV
jgi:serine O-acetyltransferase